MKGKFLVLLASTILLLAGIAHADSLQNPALSVSLSSDTLFLVATGTQTGPNQGLTNLTITGVPSTITTFSFAENVVNSTGYAWTDYHLTVTFASAVNFGPLTAPTGWTSSLVDNGGNSYTLNFFGGAAFPDGATAGTFGFDLTGLAGDPPVFTFAGTPSTTTVPEPASLWLLGTGLLGLGGVIRKRLSR